MARRPEHHRSSARRTPLVTETTEVHGADAPSISDEDEPREGKARRMEGGSPAARFLRTPSFEAVVEDEVRSLAELVVGGHRSQGARRLRRALVGYYQDDDFVSREKSAGFDEAAPRFAPVLMRRKSPRRCLQFPPGYHACALTGSSHRSSSRSHLSNGPGTASCAIRA